MGPSMCVSVCRAIYDELREHIETYSDPRSHHHWSSELWYGNHRYRKCCGGSETERSWECGETTYLLIYLYLTMTLNKACTEQSALRGPHCRSPFGLTVIPYCRVKSDKAGPAMASYTMS